MWYAKKNDNFYPNAWLILGKDTWYTYVLLEIKPCGLKF